MKTAPNRNAMVEDFKAQGFTAKQAHQLAWADFWEYGPDGRGGFYALSRVFHTVCKTCNAGGDFRAASSVRTFIQNHKGHNTNFFSKR